MAVIKELIRVESDGTISFGDYTLDTKAKVEKCVESATYKAKTYKDITKLECNDIFVYESVPGTAVTNFDSEGDKVSFEVEGVAGAQITLGLEPESEYEVTVGGESVGAMSTNLGGKLSLSVELEENVAVAIVIKKR